MKRWVTFLAALAVLVLGARPAYAWDDFGHRLVARIAWNNMTPQARTRAIAILRAAAPETGLRGSASGTLSAQQQMELFVFAATWPDVVRDTANAMRMEKYHHPTRHFVDTFWRQDTDFGPVMPSPLPQEGDLLRDTPRLQRWLAAGTPEEKALALAWLEHLVGDVHQPLHASGRVTPLDPCGDQGGNAFKLDAFPDGGRRSLHSVWDGIITTTMRRDGESPAAFLTRAANEVTAHHPRGEFTGEMGQHEFRQWAAASVAIAQRSVYVAPLVRNSAAPAAYRQAAFQAAEPRIALAGYRLADMLNQELGH
ncbi:MAG TPA: S1/P1 nuclease [Longimicrobium sp.]|nr:S1/P1 nuclease [Longimicrobium sp.]